ncbi:urease accessory protein UreD [Pseudorhodoplanes sinuspersici]|uniref:Urease accessory protein UreD n=1 Tax=Pseudorhodoplanes sinuspersici TaxID=1235591 RepID=A0A1W6ZT97_9HYPH|nr:urease accessory protein UreD [Pseudorhodoplanes sinuspersici]ARQ00637.1 urease accessory protein ureD [Pseudorhodoplanes sinuspersici]RKE72241.1 urease accessory protein [Pseudorhodoplanes sinuspersici]
MTPATGKADSASIFANNRARGHIAVSVTVSDGRTRRRQVEESGSYRIRFPNTDGIESEAVIVNTAGGVAGGDDFSVSIAASDNARLAVTTAAAEKIYRAIDTPARMNVSLSVASGAALRWLPQETILFDETRLHRDISVDLDDTASLLMVEAVIFGRAAMNETVRSGELVDRWRIRRNGRLVFAETLKLDGDVSALLARPATGKGAVALATIIMAPGHDSIVESLRALIEDLSSEAGVSAWNDIAVIRLCSVDAAALRRDLVSVLNVVGGALPRLWTN